MRFAPEVRFVGGAGKVLLLLLLIPQLALGAPKKKAEPKACPQNFAQLKGSAVDEKWLKAALKRGAWEFGGDHKNLRETHADVAKAIKMGTYEVAPIFSSTTPEHLELIASNSKYARNLSAAIGKAFKAIDSLALSEYHPEALQTDAKILLERIQLHKAGIRKGQALTPKQFEEQARIAGLEVEEFPIVYRYDQRAPRYIFDEGFQPNPELPVRSLIEHVLPGSHGSGNFVSTTSKPGNLLKIIHPTSTIRWEEAILLDSARKSMIDRIRAQGKFFYFDHETNDFEELILTRAQQNFRQQPVIYNSYEYQARNVSGVVPEKYGIESEAEVLAPNVGARQISKYRTTHLVDFGMVNGRHVYGLEQGEWTGWNSPW